MEQQRLYRVLKDSWIAGVSSGLGEYFRIDPVIIRVLFIISAFAGGGGVLIYIIFWIALPVKEHQMGNPAVEETIKVTPENPAPDPKHRGMHGGGFIAGVILIVLGLLFLLKEIIPWFSFEKLWPVLLVLLGAVIILNGLVKSKSGKNEL